SICRCSLSHHRYGASLQQACLDRLLPNLQRIIHFRKQCITAFDAMMQITSNEHSDTLEFSVDILYPIGLAVSALNWQISRPYNAKDAAADSEDLVPGKISDMAIQEWLHEQEENGPRRPRKRTKTRSMMPRIMVVPRYLISSRRFQKQTMQTHQIPILSFLSTLSSYKARRVNNYHRPGSFNERWNNHYITGTSVPIGKTVKMP
ncbi:hypothetical protein C8J56DRAFT_50113, partial [Mycena floridula]